MVYTFCGMIMVYGIYVYRLVMVYGLMGLVMVYGLWLDYGLWIMRFAWLWFMDYGLAWIGYGFWYA